LLPAVALGIADLNRAAKKLNGQGLVSDVLLANHTLPGLQLAGYIEPLGHGKWRTTQEGELVGGGKAARFAQESVERAFAGLKERIQTINADENAPYRITRAVAFGDFLGDRARVQAVTVGIELKGLSVAKTLLRLFQQQFANMGPAAW
jgi:hypothetical protein